MQFTEYSKFDKQVPTEKGAYIVILAMRRGGYIPQIRFFDPDAEYDKQWVIPMVSEYGYSEFTRTSDYGIVGFAKCDGMELNIIPEQIELNIPGFKEDDE